MKTDSFEDLLEKVVTADPRYHRDAYHFIREALDFTQKLVAKSRKRGGETETRHVSGQELLDGIRQFAVMQFGPMALTVLHEWGVKRCEDFGEIVFNLVDNGLLGKTENDTRDDFKVGYDFEEAFRKPFLPPSRGGSAIPAQATEKIDPE